MTMQQPIFLGICKHAFALFFKHFNNSLRCHNVEWYHYSDEKQQAAATRKAFVTVIQKQATYMMPVREE